MEVICEARRYGKTTKILEAAEKAKDEGYNLIVCKDRNAVANIWKQILEKNLDIPQPITHQEFLDKQYCGQNINKFFIDDLDWMVFQYMNKLTNCLSNKKIDLVSIDADSKFVKEYLAIFEESNEVKN